MPRAVLGQTKSRSGSAWPACRALPDPSRRRCSLRAPTSLQQRVRSRGWQNSAGASGRGKGDPIHRAVAAWRGSRELPDNGFADEVGTSVANNDAPDFEMPSGPGSRRLTSPTRDQHRVMQMRFRPPRPTTVNVPASALSSRSRLVRPAGRRATIRRTTGPPLTSIYTTLRPSV